MPLPDVEDAQQVLGLCTQRSKVSQPLQRALVGACAGGIIRFTEKMPVNKLACDILLLFALLPVEKINVAVAATRYLFHVIVPGLRVQFVMFRSGAGIFHWVAVGRVLSRCGGFRVRRLA